MEGEQGMGVEVNRGIDTAWRYALTCFRIYATAIPLSVRPHPPLHNPLFVLREITVSVSRHPGHPGPFLI